MAQTRQYEVTLYPAHIEGGFIVTKFQICGDTYPTRSFEAAGIPDMGARRVVPRFCALSLGAQAAGLRQGDR